MTIPDPSWIGDDGSRHTTRTCHLCGHQIDRDTDHDCEDD